jgi:hypothetical protein
MLKNRETAFSERHAGSKRRAAVRRRSRYIKTAWMQF